MTNAEMVPNRFARWARARNLVSKIQSHLLVDGTVTIGTYTRATHYRKCHAEYFKATKTGAFVKRGKRWDCIDHCAVLFN